jgi:hypothetical protein
MVYKNKLIMIMILVFVIVGCSTTRQIEIKPRAVVPPIIEGELKATVIKDTVIVANEIIRKDTVTQIKYYPKTNTFYYKIKPDTIIIMDTVKSEIVKERVEDRYDSWAMYAYLFGAIMFIIMTYKLFK